MKAERSLFVDPNSVSESFERRLTKLKSELEPAVSLIANSKYESVDDIAAAYEAG